MKLTTLNLFFLLFTVANAVKYDINSKIVNSKVVRSVDVVTQIVRISYQITAKNNGASPVDTYLFAIEPQLSDHFSFISAHVEKSKGNQEVLEVKGAVVDKHSSTKFYAVDLTKNKISPNGELTFTVETTFTHVLKPFPSYILQSEKQLVKFSGNLHFFSPYLTKTQTTEVTCTTANFASYTKESPYKTTAKGLSYGPYEDVEPFKETPLAVHYENNSPFLTVTHLTRVIEISHWGNIAVEETFDIYHSGAKLKGSFSRHDYQRSQDGLSSIKAFKTLLPLTAKDIYYRDEIGNISTSSLKQTEAGLELELRPRFPLFGGWKSQHYIGYNVPSYQYLYNQGSRFALVMKLIDHVFDDQVVDSFDLKIILPERADAIDLQTPYPVHRHDNSITKTYLDTIGRPVVHVSQSNLVEQHIQDFKLYYSFSWSLMLQEPMIVFAAFFILFLTAIVYVRLDFSIAKDEASEAKLRLSGLIRQILDLHERRSALYQSYDDAVNKFKASRDIPAFKANQKTIDGDHKSLTAQIGALQGKLKVESLDASEKISELQRLDGLVRGQINLQAQASEKFVAGRLQRQQFLDTEASIKATLADLLAAIDTLTLSM